MTAKKTTAKKPSETEKEEALRVTCVKDGFWRGGRQWTREPIVVPVSKLTPAQRALIEAEPRLKVESIELPED